MVSHFPEGSGQSARSTQLGDGTLGFPLKAVPQAGCVIAESTEPFGSL